MGKLIAAVISLIAGITAAVLLFAVLAVILLRKGIKDDWLY